MGKRTREGGPCWRCSARYVAGHRNGLLAYPTISFYTHPQLQGASQCIEDSACLGICLEHANSLSDLPKVLRAYEAIRKPRTEWLTKKGRENAMMWHLPDGEEQQQRDKYLARGPLGIPGAKEWDGKNIDDPPQGRFNPLAYAYMSGFDVMDYVSFESRSSFYSGEKTKMETLRSLTRHGDSFSRS